MPHLTVPTLPPNSMRKSVAPSQLASGMQTPRKEDMNTDSTLSSPLFSSQLQDRLKQVDGDTSTAAATTRNRIVHSIEVLAADRRKTSELAREQALGVLLREAVSKYDPGLMNYELFNEIVQSYVTARSSVEAMTALQLICASLSLVENSDDVRADDCLDLVRQLMASLPKRMDSTNGSVELRQAVATSFAVLTYYLNAGGGGYGIESSVTKLMEAAESQTGEDAGVAAAALGGATLLTTLCSSATSASIANDWLYSLIPMLDAPHLPTKLAAAKFLVVIVERCEKERLSEGDNKDACDEIVSTIESMAQESATRTSKRDKKIQNLLFKSVLKFINAKLGENEGDPDDIGDNENSLVSQYHKNTVRKSMGITTWSALVVVEHLSWVFGPGLHIQLAINPSIQSLLKKEELKIDSQGYEPEVEDDETRLFGASTEHKVTEIKKSKDRRKEQLRKAEDHGLTSDKL